MQDHLVKMITALSHVGLAAESNRTHTPNQDHWVVLKRSADCVTYEHAAAAPNSPTRDGDVRTGTASKPRQRSYLSG